MSRYSRYNTRPPEIEMIMDEDSWPCWPILPMKNHNLKDADVLNMPALGVIIAGKTSRVILINMCDIKTMTDESPTIEYPSTAAMLAAGWIVD